MPRAMMFAFSEPTDPADDDAYNSWYDAKHLPDVVQLPGIVTAARYKLVQGGGVHPQQRYLAVYELDAETEDDLAKVSRELRAAVSEGRVDVHTSMNLSTVGTAFAMPIGERLES
jgi:hypothetical protein